MTLLSHAILEKMYRVGHRIRSLHVSVEPGTSRPPSRASSLRLAGGKVTSPRLFQCVVDDKNTQ